MVGYRRNFVPGGTFFFTLTLADRRSMALTDHVAILRDAFRITRRTHPFSIDAIVVLPDHLHVIMTLPDKDAGFPIRLALIKRRFTEGVLKAGVPVPRHRSGEHALWQRRFWEHTIRDDRDFEKHVDYVRYNPVKHGLVSQVSAWPYSSFHRYGRNGLLSAGWGGNVNEVTGGYGEPRA